MGHSEEVKPGLGLYGQVSALIDEWVEAHADETFDLEKLCRQLDISSREGRKQVTVKLFNLIKKGKLEKNSNIYRVIYIHRDIEEWWNADEDYFKLNFPSNHHTDDLSYFPFQDSVNIPPKSIAVIAGQTSAGKSTILRNVLWDNMHNIRCVYMVSETSPASFRRYTNNMKWADPMKDGKPVFDFISRSKDFQDIIEPDSLNIIDWLDIPSGEFYRIGQELLHIKEKLNKGIAIVAIQKDGGKDYGRGGTFSIELASLYLTIDYDRDNNFNWVSVKKAKEWSGSVDPNNKNYGFQITDYGTQLSNIREIKKCTACFGTGKTKGGQCMACTGIGWIDGWKVTHQVKQPELTEASNDINADF